MKLKIKTTKFQELLTKSVKGASNNKMIPLTGLIEIQLKDNKLTLVTTDGTNYLYVAEDKVEGEDFYIVVKVDTLAKLVSRTTSEYITLEIKENMLEVAGNGNYSIEIPLDEEGKPIKFPNPLENFDETVPKTEIHLSTIKLILATAKSALATTMEVPCYTGYYIGNNVITTDTYKICGIGIKLLPEPVLVSPEMMDLLDVMTDEKIYVMSIDNKLVFTSTNCTIYGTQLEGIEDYAVDAISNLIEEEFESVCALPKSELLGLLDRLELFVGVYDKNGVYLTFTREGLAVSSKASSGVEIIHYMESTGFKEFTCCIDIEMLRSQVKAQTGDKIEMWYGKDNSIKLVDGNVTQIIALLEDERIE